MDLQKAVNEKFAELIDEGYVDKLVKTTLQSTIKTIVEQSLRNYSDFAQQLEKHIGKGMVMNLERLNMTHYNDVVLQTVEEEVNGTLIAEAQQRIRERIGKLMGKLPSESMKLSQLVEEFKQSVSEYDDLRGEIGFELRRDNEDRVTAIYLDKESHEERSTSYGSTVKKPKEYFMMKYRLSLNKEGRVSNFSIDKGRLDHRTGVEFGFDALMFQLYANGTQIIVDENDTELSYSPDANE